MENVEPFWVKMTVQSIDGAHERTVDALVGTGASFAVLPASVLQNIGIEPTRRHTFRLPDGRQKLGQVSDALITIDGMTGPSPVVFGPEDSPARVGYLTLSALLLDIVPGEQRLTPVDGRLPGFHPVPPRPVPVDNPKLP
ncbi:MAG: hypothetical protein OXN15_02410 [Chloroflexota bacterium]|nr:hypothetical protein [Chloroflexota bacterium]MDE2970090.1 hypothetical protein [Chloroflexota bacterium]